MFESSFENCVSFDSLQYIRDVIQKFGTNFFGRCSNANLKSVKNKLPILMDYVLSRGKSGRKVFHGWIQAPPITQDTAKS